MEKTFTIYFLKRPICVLWQFVKTQVPIQLLVVKKLMATAVPILKLNRNSVDETNGSKENRMKWMHKHPKRETVVEVLQLRRTTFPLHYTYTHQINTQQWIKLHFTLDSCQAIFVDLPYLLQYYSIYLGSLLICYIKTRKEQPMPNSCIVSISMLRNWGLKITRNYISPVPG